MELQLAGHDLDLMPDDSPTFSPASIVANGFRPKISIACSEWTQRGVREPVDLFLKPRRGG